MTQTMSFDALPTPDDLTPPPPPPPPGKPGMSTKKKVLLGLGVLTIVGLVAGQGDAAPEPAASDAPVTSSTTVTRETPVVPVTTPTTVPARVSDRDRLLAWFNGGGDDTLQELSDAQSDVAAAGAAASMPRMRAACTTLRSIAMSALSDPIPVASVNAPYLRGIRAYATAAQNCVAGIDALDPDLLEEAVQGMQEGTDGLADATTALSVYR